MMQYRKAILTAAFGALVLFWAGDWLSRNALRGPMDVRRAKAARLNKQIQAKQKEFNRLRADGKQLDAWAEQSLPSNVEVARGLYQAWLLELADHVGLTGTNVDSSDPTNVKGMYHVLSFSMRGRGTVEQLTKFLFEFYRSNHLHQVRGIQITPAGRGESLDLSFAIEALALRGLKRQDRLSNASSDRLVFDSLQDYQAIVRRNIFVASGHVVDVTGQARLTAVTQIDGRPLAWFSADGPLRTIKAVEGETLQLGTLQAKVTEILDHDVILEVDGQRWLMSIGDSIMQASALPPGL